MAIRPDLGGKIRDTLVATCQYTDRFDYDFDRFLMFHRYIMVV